MSYNYSQDGSSQSFYSAGAGGASYSTGNASFLSGGSSNATVSQIATDLLSFSQGSSGAVSGGVSGGFSGAVSGGFSGIVSGGVDAFAFASQVEASILASVNPLQFNASKTMTAVGQTGLWLNEQEILSFKGDINRYIFVEDANPQVITKKVQQQLEYVQELAIRYLRPPTPPAPGEIVIQMEANSLSGPAPPLIIRQVPARPDTPEPLVLREAPPQPPAAVGRKLITISGKRLSPPPRKVVIERLPQLPSKPQSVLVERWLPYSQAKRRVIFQKSGAVDQVIVAPRNVIVQWEAPAAVIRKEFKYLGVIRANPAEYVAQYGASLKISRDLPQFVLDIKTPEGLVLAADFKYSSFFELEGDIEALKMVDLKKEGLSEYIDYLARLFGVKSNQAQIDSFVTLLEKVFYSVDVNKTNVLRRSDIRTVVTRLNQTLGRNYSDEDASAFYSALDSDGSGDISLAEFKSTFLKLVNLA